MKKYFSENITGEHKQIIARALLYITGDKLRWSDARSESQAEDIIYDLSGDSHIKLLYETGEYIVWVSVDFGTTVFQSCNKFDQREYESFEAPFGGKSMAIGRGVKQL
jgi:hypothetical protein